MAEGAGRGKEFGKTFGLLSTYIVSRHVQYSKRKNMFTAYMSKNKRQNSDSEKEFSELWQRTNRKPPQKSNKFDLITADESHSRKKTISRKQYLEKRHKK